MMDFPSSPTDGQASNGYTWSAAKGAWVGGPGTRYTQAEADAKFVDVTGDTMSGHLFLPTGPAAANAIRKDYVDSALTLKADKTYTDTQLALKANLTGAAFTGAVTGTSLRMSGELKSDVGILRLNVADSAYLYWDGANYSLGSAGTIWHTGNFNPAAYAPVGGVGGNFNVGSVINTQGLQIPQWFVCAHSNALGGLNGVAGLCYQPNTPLCVENFSAGSTNIFLNRNGTGWVQGFYNNGTQIGSISLNATQAFYNTGSDGRLKEGLTSFDAGPIIDSIDVYDFHWKGTTDRGHGVVAQEAIEVYPNAVNYNEHYDAWGVDYSKYVPLLLQEVKALRARIAALEAA